MINMHWVHYLASRNPVKAKYRVRGMGVAERVRTSIEVLKEAIFSFCLTPNLWRDRRNRRKESYS